MTVTLTIEELRSYEDKLIAWNAKRVSVILKCVERVTSLSIGDREYLNTSVKTALANFTEKPPKLTDQI